MSLIATPSFQHSRYAEPGQRYHEQSPTERRLIYYSKTFIELLNTRQYNHSFFPSHVSQNVFVDFHGQRTTGFAPFIDNYKQDADRSPDFHVDIEMNGTAMVDEDKGTATVLLSQHITGFEDEFQGMNKAATILFSWRRAKGRWSCGSAKMMVGTPEFLV